MAENKYVRFRGREFKNLGELCDELSRIASIAPEDAEDFRMIYTAFSLRNGNAKNWEEAEAIIASNIRWFASQAGGTSDEYHKIMQTFYPLVEVEV